MKQLNINPVFRDLIQSLTADEFKQLEDNVLAEGIRDAIVVWNDTIVDGHNRYQLAQKHRLQFDLHEVDFNSQDEAVLWIIDNQLGRRNLTDFAKLELQQKRADVLYEQGRNVMSAGAINRGFAGNQHAKVDGLSIIDKPSRTEPAHNTQKEIAEALNWSTGKVAQGQYVIKHAPEEVKHQLRAGELSINQAYQHIKGEQEKKNHYAQVAEKIKANDIKPQSEINEIIAQEFDVKHGDVYLINDRHILIVADAFQDIDYIRENCPEINCVLTDPPYGISYKSPTGNGLAQRGDYKVIEGDDQEFEPRILFDYSRNVITWGANHYANKLENSAGWLIWDKRDGEAINNNSDCELAWTNMLGSARLFHHKWNGMIKDSERGEKRIHPTQKPVKLFEWCLDITRSGQVIIDPFAGSGIIIIACDNTDRTAIAIERDTVYAAAILNRMQELNFSITKK